MFFAHEDTLWSPILIHKHTHKAQSQLVTCHYLSTWCSCCFRSCDLSCELWWNTQAVRVVLSGSQRCFPSEMMSDSLLSNSNTSWHCLQAAKSLTILFSQLVITLNQMQELTTCRWPGAGLVAKHWKLAVLFTVCVSLTLLLTPKRSQESVVGSGWLGRTVAVRHIRGEREEQNSKVNFMAKVSHIHGEFALNGWDIAIDCISREANHKFIIFIFDISPTPMLNFRIRKYKLNSWCAT